MIVASTKTLVIILNHNLLEFTDRLYHSLYKYQRNDYLLEVMDNGSKPEYISPHATIKLPKNIFWGGALNKAFELVLEHPEYDSLLFLNNDIEVTGEIFVKALRKELFLNDYALVTPCIAGAPRPWKQMQNWGTKGTRRVKWIDNQAPLFHRKLIEKVRRFDESLFYGWGQEFICFDVCEENKWKIGVCDHITMLHYAKQTVIQNKLFSSYEATIPFLEEKIIEWKEFEDEAMASYTKYFKENPLKYSTFEDLRSYGLTYTNLNERILAKNSSKVFKALINILLKKLKALKI